MQASKQAPCLPGMVLIGQGFDFTRQKLADLKENSNKYVLGQTVSSPPIPQNVLGNLFQVSVQTLSRGLSATGETGTSTTYTSVIDVQQAYRSKFTAAGRYGTVEADAAVAYDTKVGQKLERGLRIAEQEYRQPMFTVVMDSSNTLYHPNFLSDLQSFPNSSSGNEQAWLKRFIDNYGTHYITSITMGGILKLSVFASSCTSRKCLETTLATEASAAFTKGVSSVKGSSSVSTAKSSCTSRESGSIKSELLRTGGEFDACPNQKDCNTGEWSSSVSVQRPLSLEVIKVNVEPLWKAVDDLTLRSKLQAALEAYVIAARRPAGTEPQPLDCEPEAKDHEASTSGANALSVVSVVVFEVLTQLAWHNCF